MRLIASTLFLSLIAPVARHEPVLQYLVVGTHKVPFEIGGIAVPFTSVAKILGGNPKAKDYAMDTPTICYHLTGPAPQMILVFSGDDMGSSVLTEFELVPASTRRELAGKCGRLNVAALQVATDRGVRLGLSRADVERALGKAERESGTTATYEATEERSTTGDGGNIAHYRITSGITVTYRGGTVVAFSGGISDED